MTAGPSLSPDERPQGGAIRALVADLWHHHRAATGRAVLLSALAPLAEGGALLLLAPIVARLSSGDGEGALPLLAAATGLLLVRAALGYARTATALALVADYEAGLGRRIAARLSARGWPFIRDLGGARVQALVERDAGAAINACHDLLALVGAAALLAAQAAAGLATAWRLTLAGLGLMALAALLVWPFVRHARRMGGAMLDSAADATADALRLMNEMKGALAQGTEHRFVDRYAQSLGRAARVRARFGRDQARVAALAVAGGALVAALIVAIAQGLAMSAAATLAVLAILARMAGPGQALLHNVASLSAEAQGLARIEALLGAGPTALAAHRQARPLDWTRLEARGVAIAAAGLDATDLVLARGEWIALDGPSGAGKTSLIDALVGLLGVDAGEILVDGAPLDADRIEGWRAGIGYVGQDAPLFAASLEDNLTAGADAPDGDALAAVLETVGLAGTVAALPQGLATMIGERGMRLSGGERQRLAIARALLRDPSLLVLDEATGALDAAAEAAILGAIRRERPGMALLLVAHRPESHRHADRVVAL